MPGWFYASLSLSVLFGITKLILESAGKGRVLGALKSIYGILLLSVMLSSVSITESSLPSIEHTDQSAEFSLLHEETLAEILSTAETELAASLKEELYCFFGKTPLSCAVMLDRKNFNVSHIKVVYAQKDALLSTYEIKKHIYTTYGVQAEVSFE